MAVAIWRSYRELVTSSRTLEPSALYARVRYVLVSVVYLLHPSTILFAI
jgi:hypothetical protein